MGRFTSTPAIEWLEDQVVYSNPLYYDITKDGTVMYRFSAAPKDRRAGARHQFIYTIKPQEGGPPFQWAWWLYTEDWTP